MPGAGHCSGLRVFLTREVFFMPNPYLPSWEYIPDGEPKCFGDRVYIYGSHDKPGA